MFVDNPTVPPQQASHLSKYFLDIEPEKAEVALRNGVLTVTLPKAAQAETAGHRIPISKAA